MGFSKGGNGSLDLYAISNCVVGVGTWPSGEIRSKTLRSWVGGGDGRLVRGRSSDGW